MPERNRGPFDGSGIIHVISRSAVRLHAEIWLIIALGLAMLVPGITRPPLLDWDEATYAEVGHEAIANGDYVDLTWNAAPYVKKPPLLFWLIAGSFRTFGESEFAARVPSIVCAIATMLLLYASACEVGGRVSGLFAALIPLGFYFFVARGGRECATDPPLVMFSTLALYAIVKSRTARGWIVISGAAVGLAILSKGAAGLIPLIVIAIAAAAVPGFSGIGAAGFAVIVGAVVIVAGPWYIYEALYNPLFWKSLVAHETIRRLATHLEDQTKPANYTIVTFGRELYWLLPIAAPLALLAATQARDGMRGAMKKIRPALLLWVIWLTVALGAACAVQTKLPWYILPALIPAALLAGAILGAAFEPGPPQGIRAAVGAVAVLLLIMQLPSRMRVISTTLAVERSHSVASRAMALKARDAAAERGAGELYFAGVELPALVYYSGLHCNFVRPEQVTEIDLGADDSAPIDMRKSDLVLVPPSGDPVLVTNFDYEWNLAAEPQSPRPQPEIEEQESPDLSAFEDPS